MTTMPQINYHIAQAVLALINSKPTTPTGAEIIHAIDVAHFELGIPRSRSSLASQPSGKAPEAITEEWRHLRTRVEFVEFCALVAPSLAGDYLSLRDDAKRRTDAALGKLSQESEEMRGQMR